MISGPASYPPTCAEFIQHWEAVDAFLGAGNNIILADGSDWSNLGDQRDNLETLRDAVTDAAVDRAFAREQLNTLIATLQGRLVQFNNAVRAALPETAYERILQKAFAVGDGEEAVRNGLRAMARMWTKVNAISPAPPGLLIPMTLLGGYTLALFNADRETLRLRYVALSDADVDLGLARGLRNDLQEVIYEILKNYRLRMPTTVPAGHALVATLPALLPPEGHTPEPVAAQAVWVPAEVKALVTWEESADPDLVSYQVRGAAGPDYEVDDEILIATVPAGGTREVLTDFALNMPGITAGFKVYVVLDTGRERGSLPRFVTRPL